MISDIIDPAVLRPGRLDKTLYVGLPTVEDRTDILKTITKNCTMPCIDGVSLEELAGLPQCDGFRLVCCFYIIRNYNVKKLYLLYSFDNLPSNIEM